jgi:short-subunit dehydrogenase
MERMRLAEKRVLISGASGGLGRALALELASRGARLGLLARNRNGLIETARRARRLGSPEIRLYQTDLSKPAARTVAQRATRELGGLDILVNNAGVHAFAPVAELPEDMLQRVLQVNLFGVLRLTQGALPALRQAQGWVVNIGSTLGYRAIPNAAAYSATKAALARFSESLRDEESRWGVHVLHVSPGVVITKLRENALRYKVSVDPQERLPYPRDPDLTAREICDAIERGEREYISAAFPVKVWAKILAPHFGRFLDRKMRL